MVIAAGALCAQMTVALATPGSWTIVPSPNPPASLATLASVSCLTSTSCFAVGDAFAHGSDRPLVEHWDGAAWSVVPTPALSVIGSLGAVSCASAGFCVAVGDTFASSGGPARLSLLTGTAPHGRLPRAQRPDREHRLLVCHVSILRTALPSEIRSRPRGSSKRSWSDGTAASGRSSKAPTLPARETG